MVARVARWAALASLAALSGCLHHRDVVPCKARVGESECWESSRSDARGRLRHVVIERVTPAPRCDKVWVEQDSFDENGVLVERAVDERRCGVVDRRTIDRYDLAHGELEHEVWIDSNHDDRFDRVVVHHVPLSAPQRSMALHANAIEEAELATAHHRGAPVHATSVATAAAR